MFTAAEALQLGTSYHLLVEDDALRFCNSVITHVFTTCLTRLRNRGVTELSVFTSAHPDHCPFARAETRVPKTVDPC